MQRRQSQTKTIKTWLELRDFLNQQHEKDLNKDILISFGELETMPVHKISVHEPGYVNRWRYMPIRLRIGFMRSENGNGVDLFGLPVDLLNYDNRAKNVLAKLGIQTITDLLRLKPLNFVDLPGCGEATYQKILRNLNRAGIIEFSELDRLYKAYHRAEMRQQRIKSKSDSLNNKIDDIPLSARSMSVLDGLKIRKFKQLLRYSKEQIKAHPKCGRNSLSEINAAVVKLTGKDLDSDEDRIGYKYLRDYRLLETSK